MHTCRRKTPSSSTTTLSACGIFSVTTTIENLLIRYEHNSCFFSSRRRHTILQGDWSSDVCFPIYGRPPWLPEPGKFGVGDCRAHVTLGDRVHVLSEGREQRFVGKYVDAAREPAGGTCHPGQRARREHVGSPVAGRPHAERYVFGDFGRRQRAHAKSVRNAVAQLAQ